MPDDQDSRETARRWLDSARLISLVFGGLVVRAYEQSSLSSNWMISEGRIATVVIWGIAFIVFIAGVAGIATAPTVVIDFEDFEQGRGLTTETQNRGILFEAQDDEQAGVIVTTCEENIGCSEANSGQNVIVTPVDSLATPGFFGTPRHPLITEFTEPQQAVRLYVQGTGDIQGSQIAMLTARDETDAVVAQSQIRFEPRTGWHQIAVSTDSPAITRVRLTVASEEIPDNPHNMLIVDDLSFSRNEPPQATFTSIPENPSVGDEVTFDASASTDFDGEIIEYRWDFTGDGDIDRIVQQSTVSRTFSNPGTYSITLEVMDNEEAISRTSEVVTVGQEPQASCSVSDTDVEQGEEIIIDASQSTAELVRFDVDGDGEFEQTYTSDFRASVRYDAPGTIRPQVQAEIGEQTDRQFCPAIRIQESEDAGGIGSDVIGGASGGVFGLWALRKIHSKFDDDGGNRPPNAELETVPADPEPGRPVLFDGTGSSDPDSGDHVAAYRWKIGDKEAIGPRVVDTFLQEGDHDIQLQVSDLQGAIDSTSTTVAVEATEGELVVAAVHPDAPGNDHENLDQEYLVFQNTGEAPLELGEWTIHDTVEAEGRVESGDHTYTFPENFELSPDETVSVHTGSTPDATSPETGSDAETRLYWGKSRAIWNNDKDKVVVEDDNGYPVLAVEYTRTDADTYETEDLDFELLDEWFGSVVVSRREETGLVHLVPGSGLAVAFGAWLVGVAWGCTFLAGPKRFVNSWANITGYVLSASVAWAVVTVSGMVPASIEPIVPILLVIGSTFMMVIGGIGVLVGWILSSVFGWITD